LKEHYEKKMKDLMANTVGAVVLQQIKQEHEQKVNAIVLVGVCRHPALR
jgi:Rho guanine nucleotide exchange factor 10